MNNNEVVGNTLKIIPLFNNLGPVPLARLAERSGTMKFNRGTVIIQEGKQCHNLFVIISGKLELYKKINDENEIIIQTISRGEVFGDAFLLDVTPMGASLRAAENSLVVCIDRLTVNSFIRDYPEFSRNYIRLMNTRLREAMQRETTLLHMMITSEIEIPDIYLPQTNAVSFDEDMFSSCNGGQPSSANQGESDEIAESDSMLFSKEYACPLCGNRFRTSKPRQRSVIVLKSDEDFCGYYKTVNPVYYEINVCPRCGYAFNNSTSSPVKPNVRKEMLRFMSDIHKEGSNYCGSRTLEDAIEVFKMALACQKKHGAGDDVMGKLYLKMGWLYRYKKMNQEEQEYLDKALYHLSKAFETNMVEDPKEEMNLMFLLGQLHLITGDENGAVNWFAKITQHPQRAKYPYIVNRARGSWQDIRQKRAKEAAAEKRQQQ